QVLAPVTGNCTLILRFTPATANVFASSINVAYSGAQSGALLSMRAITGTGALDCLNHNQAGQCPPPAPSLTVDGQSTTPYTFGSLAIATFVTHTFTVSNGGNANATLGSITESDLGISAPYSLIGGTCRTGKVLTSLGGSCTLIVRLMPTAAGTASLT